jgi:hypothetical protein
VKIKIREIFFLISFIDKFKILIKKQLKFVTIHNIRHKIVTFLPTITSLSINTAEWDAEPQVIVTGTNLNISGMFVDLIKDSGITATDRPIILNTNYIGITMNVKIGFTDTGLWNMRVTNEYGSYILNNAFTITDVDGDL